MVYSFQILYITSWYGLLINKLYKSIFTKKCYNFMYIKWFYMKLRSIRFYQLNKSLKYELKKWKVNHTQNIYFVFWNGYYHRLKWT